MRERKLSLESNIREFLLLLNQDVSSEGLQNTPNRVAKAWRELLTPEEFKITTFDANGHSQMIVCKDIRYYTFCEHHLLPFFGEVSIGYIPNKKIVGLSKLPRTVETFSKALNTQEYFTDNMGKFLSETLQPKGLGVVVTGRHLCQEMRGVKKYGQMNTSYLEGEFMEDHMVRKEFFELCRK